MKALIPWVILCIFTTTGLGTDFRKVNGVISAYGDPSIWTPFPTKLQVIRLEDGALLCAEYNDVVDQLSRQINRSVENGVAQNFSVSYRTNRVYTGMFVKIVNYHEANASRLRMYDTVNPGNSLLCMVRTGSEVIPIGASGRDPDVVRTGRFNNGVWFIHFYVFDCGVESAPPTHVETQAEINQKALSQRSAQQKVFESHLARAQSTNSAAADCYRVGLDYLYGRGCVTNRAEAITWIKKAADLGSEEATNKLMVLNLPD
jgi:hypothetical protein